MLNNNKKLASITSALILAGTIVPFTSASAQETERRDDVVEYEFTFRYDAEETEEARRERLSSEAGSYCDTLTEGRRDVSSRDCQREITVAVNDQVDERSR